MTAPTTAPTPAPTPAAPTTAPGFVLLASLAWWGVFVVGRLSGHVQWGLAALGVVVVALLLRPPATRARWFVASARVVAVDVGFGLAVGVASVAATHLAFAPLAARLPSLAGEVDGLYALAGVGLSTLGATLVVIVAEEVLWRGAAGGALVARVPSGAARAALATGLYAAAQSGGGSVWLVVAALGLGGLWAALAAARGGRLVAPLVAHAVWTLLVLGAWPLRR